MMIFMMQFIKVSVLQEPPEWEVIFSLFFPSSLPFSLRRRRWFLLWLMRQAEPSSSASARHMKPTPPSTPASSESGTRERRDVS